MLRKSTFLMSVNCTQILISHGSHKNKNYAACWTLWRINLLQRPQSSIFRRKSRISFRSSLSSCRSASMSPFMDCIPCLVSVREVASGPSVSSEKNDNSKLDRHGSHPWVNWMNIQVQHIQESICCLSQQSWDRELAMSDVWPVGLQRAISLDASPCVLVYTWQILFRKNSMKNACSISITKWEPPSWLCIKFIILLKKTVILWNPRKHLQYFDFGVSLIKHDFHDFRLTDFSIHVILKRRFWTRKTKSLQLLLWRVVKNLLETVCKYFRVLTLSCFLVLESPSYWIEHSS